MSNTIIVPGAPVSDALKAVKAAIKRELGADIARFPKCTDPAFGHGPQSVAAVRELQSRRGLVADGVIGPQTLTELKLDAGWPKLPAGLGIDLVQKMFPFTRRSNIERYLPYVLAALRAVAPGASGGKVPVEIVLSALATIRAETEGFIPLTEGRSKYNTEPGQPLFNRYYIPLGKVLGNKSLADAQHFCGRGFIQLTGRDNYQRYGKTIGVDLVTGYELANSPEVAACLLVEFIAAKADKLLASLRATPPDFKAARKLVNGGHHGIERYTEAYETGLSALKAVAPLAGAGKGKRPSRKSTASAAALPRRAGAKPDPLDLRDRPYQPRVSPLPMEYPPADRLARHLVNYVKRTGLLLHQGSEGSCTGFGLACVVNFQRWVLAGAPARKFESVSPRMLYEMSRRYDEYEGEDYDGSSCRGAIRGFHQNGVCREAHWKYHADHATQPVPDWPERARDITLGVYYRIDTKVIADVQAAIVEAGAVFVSARTHDGWADVKKTPLGARFTLGKLPTLEWPTALDDRAHAFALVGFDREGFIFQNSWGSGWGASGFARIRYADWLENAMDAWVLSLGVPGVLPREVNLRGSGTATAGVASAAGSLDARRYTIEMGNDGRVDSFYGGDERLRTLGGQAGELPATWFAQNTAGGKPWKLVLYAHGGLTSLDDALRKTATMAPSFLRNGLYPLFLGWKTGGIETHRHILEDAWNQLSRGGRAMAGGGLGDTLREARDAAVETLARGPVRALWSEMKENAARAARERHGLDLLARALDDLVKRCPTSLELHLVGHSAGSILLGHLVRSLEQRRNLVPTSIHLYAPACSVAFANDYYAPWFERTHLHVLSDRAELADKVTSAYGKSLLFLVANALEADRLTPILGMARSFDARSNGKWNGLADTLDSLNRLQAEWALDAKGRHPRIAFYDTPVTTWADASGRPLKTEPPWHGAFDNDVGALTRVLTHILGDAPKVPVLDLRNC